MESHFRSIIKAVTWRTGGSIVTFAVAWIVTDNISISVGIGLLDTVIKIGAFYIHERIWNRFQFGISKPPEYQI